MCGTCSNSDSGRYKKPASWDLAHRDYCDYQEIKIQEPTSGLAIGAIPRTLTIVLQYDLAGQCSAGDSITAVGLLRARCGHLAENVRPDVRMILDAQSLHVKNSNNDDAALSITVQDELKKDFDEFWRDRADEMKRR